MNMNSIIDAAILTGSRWNHNNVEDASNNVEDAKNKFKKRGNIYEHMLKKCFSSTWTTEQEGSKK